MLRCKRMSSMKRIVKELLSPVEYCWKATEVASRSWPYPNAMHVLVTASSSLLAYALGIFLVIVLIRGIVSFF